MKKISLEQKSFYRKMEELQISFDELLESIEETPKTFRLSVINVVRGLLRTVSYLEPTDVLSFTLKLKDEFCRVLLTREKHDVDAIEYAIKIKNQILRFFFHLLYELTEKDYESTLGILRELQLYHPGCNEEDVDLDGGEDLQFEGSDLKSFVTYVRRLFLCKNKRCLGCEEEPFYSKVFGFSIS